MVAVPAVRPETSPVPDTVAMLVALELHVTVAATELPFWSVEVALSCTACPT
jgi:hypothetical protein